MNNEFTPKKGFYVEFEHLPFPKEVGWSFSLGLSKHIVQHCMNGYGEPPTHGGYKTEFFITCFHYQFSIGYNSVKELKQTKQN